MLRPYVTSGRSGEHGDDILDVGVRHRFVERHADPRL